MNAGQRQPTSGASNIVSLAAARQVERTPPHDEEAERAVLGSLLLRPEAMDECLVKLAASAKERWGAGAFYQDRHQVIFEVMAEMHEQHQVLDLLTLKRRLADRGWLERAGGESYLAELLGCVPTASNVLAYLEVVRDCALRRQLIELGSRIVVEAFDSRHEKAEILAEEADRMVLEITQKHFPHDAVHVKNLTEAVMGMIETAAERKGALLGLSSGFRDLDQYTCGFQAGDMIVLAARPSVGKTALAMNIVEHVGVEQKLPVAVFSLEMSREQLLLRMVSSLARVDGRKIREGFISDTDHGRILQAMTRIGQSHVFIDDTGAMTVTQLRAKARRLTRHQAIKLIVVDYLQLLRCSTVRRNDGRAQEVSEISGGIKALAKELKVPILVLSQLNRESAGEGRRPKLHHLRESGAIEQDADVVMLLSRGDGNEEEGADLVADLEVAKQRNGPTGTLQLTFLKNLTRFEQLARVGGDSPADAV